MIISTHMHMYIHPLHIIHTRNTPHTRPHLHIPIHPHPHIPTPSRVRSHLKPPSHAGVHSGVHGPQVHLPLQLRGGLGPVRGQVLTVATPERGGILCHMMSCDPTHITECIHTYHTTSYDILFYITITTERHMYIHCTYTWDGTYICMYVCLSQVNSCHVTIHHSPRCKKLDKPRFVAV